jgi:hypothetical protein
MRGGCSTDAMIHVSFAEVFRHDALGPGAFAKPHFGFPNSLKKKQMPPG